MMLYSRLSLLRYCGDKENVSIYPDYRYNQSKFILFCLCLGYRYVYIIPWMVSYFIPYLPEAGYIRSRNAYYHESVGRVIIWVSRPDIDCKGRYGMKYETIHGIIYLSHIAYLNRSIFLTSVLLWRLTYMLNRVVIALRSRVLRMTFPEVTWRYVMLVKYVTLRWIRYVLFVLLRYVALRYAVYG